MASVRTALYLCGRVRFHTGIYDRSILRDGFSDDLGEADRDILSAINDAQRLFFPTGQFVCEFTQEMIADQRLYPKQGDMGLIKSIHYDDVPLDHESIQQWDGNKKSWKTQASGTPTAYYLDFPDYIGLWPPPADSDTAGEPSLRIIAEVVAQDLVEPEDYPERMPSGFHEGLAYVASILVCNSFGGMDSKIAILQPFMDSYMTLLQANAQHGEYGETGQFIPHNYRRNNRR